jgi:prepilin-type N-terminal cleavage/methylation domain-containing protein
MRNTQANKGFTLIEMLMALALIATILSMVFGSYFATTRSAQVCQSRIAMDHQGRTVLDQVARQIRCVYAGKAKEADRDESGIQQKRLEQKADMSYFSGNQNAPNGEILRFVTTIGFSQEKEKPEKGLFEITYRFDKRTRTLSLSQRPFVSGMKKSETRSWMPIAENIERLELEFCDGRQWYRRWEFEDEKKVPSAVRIEIGCRDEDDRRCDYSTVAHISCYYEARTNNDTFVSANKQ